MNQPQRSEIDPWDVERLRLPAECYGEFRPSRRLPRHGAGEPFIKGPITYRWVTGACGLPGAGLHVATTFRFLCCRYRGPNRWGLDQVARGLQISLRTARRGLHEAELAGLLSVVREPGCKLAVSVVDPPGGGEKSPGPLYGPIPWAWWVTALRLDGPAVRTAAACWLVGGWERSAEFELALARWADLGLTRRSAGRG